MPHKIASLLLLLAVKLNACGLQCDTYCHYYQATTSKPPSPSRAEPSLRPGLRLILPQAQCELAARYRKSFRYVFPRSGFTAIEVSGKNSRKFMRYAIDCPPVLPTFFFGFFFSLHSQTTCWNCQCGKV